MSEQIKLGDKVKDKVSGFAGIATGPRKLTARFLAVLDYHGAGHTPIVWSTKRQPDLF